MLTSCNTMPQRGVTMVASRLNGWYKAARKSVPLGTRHQIPVAYLRHAIRQHPHYQPLKWLATIV